jgi:hypothetical protein
VSRVVLVTARWGDSHGESGAVVRLLAGALSAQSEVEVVSLLASGELAASEPTASGRPVASGRPAPTRRDGVFTVHEMSASRAEPAHAGLLRGALALGGGGRLPEITGPRLLELAGGFAPGAAELIASLDPDSVLLVGPETWWLPEVLEADLAGTRVASVPILGDDPLGALTPFLPLAAGVDAVGVLSLVEERLVARQIESASGRIRPGRPEIVELGVAFPVNRPAAEQLMVGMSHFGRFVVLLTAFPDGSPAASRAPGHDYVRRSLGPIAVAEVALDRWVVSDREKSRDVPVKPSRPNLWKLLSHAEVCLDLRPQGVVGRETLESLLLGTPVVVPEGTVAAEHAERSNGGLWYRDYSELFGAAKAILDSASLRSSLSEQGREWAERVHGDQRRFSEQVARLALG